MPIIILVGIYFTIVAYNIAQGCIKNTPVIEDKDALLRSFVGKSKAENRKILKGYKQKR